MNLIKPLLKAYLVVTVVLLPLAPAQEQPADGQAASSQQAGQPTPPQTGQESTPATTPANPSANPLEQEPPGGKRVLGVLPNYRTASSEFEGKPITAKQKLTIAAKDSFDYPLVLLAAAYAGLDQLDNDDKSYGQGVEGYAKRLGAWYADEAIGNMFTEGVFPSLFHQDPRYFRRGPEYGGVWKRTGYALTRVIITDSDSGKHQFNYSEWVGNGAATAIGNIYHVDGRDASTNTYRLLEQIGTDAVSQVLKEFWPDIKKKFFHKGGG
jgi:hypothetical protein